jgi:hypothetical protein
MSLAKGREGPLGAVGMLVPLGIWSCWLYEDAPMREVVGFIQLACALTLGMAGGWAVHQMGVVLGWSGF